MNLIISYVKNLAVFLIFMTFVQMILPKTKFKEYIGMIMGIMLIFLVLQPISALLTDGFEPIEKNFNNFTLRYQEKMIARDREFYEGAIDEEILSAYEKELSIQAKTLLDVSTEWEVLGVTMEVSRQKDNLGAILSCSIRVVEQIIAEKRNFIYIEPIEIKKNTEKTPQEAYTEKYLHIKEIIHEFYHIPLDQIYVSVDREKEK